MQASLATCLPKRRVCMRACVPACLSPACMLARLVIMVSITACFCAQVHFQSRPWGNGGTTAGNVCCESGDFGHQQRRLASNVRDNLRWNRAGIAGSWCCKWRRLTFFVRSCVSQLFVLRGYGTTYVTTTPFSCVHVCMCWSSNRVWELWQQCWVRFSRW